MHRINISTAGPYEATNRYRRCAKIEHESHSDFFFAGTIAPR